MSFINLVATYASQALFVTGSLCLVALVVRGVVTTSTAGKSSKKRKRKRANKNVASADSEADTSLQPDPVPNPPTVPSKQRKTLAEKHYEQKTRKEPSKVRDMIEEPSEPATSRLMRIVPEQTTPSEFSSWDQIDSSTSFSEVEEEKDQPWQEIPQKPRSVSLKIKQSQPQQQFQSRSVPGLPEQTKKQRQNAAKAAKAKEARAEAETDRLAALKQHRQAQADEASKQRTRKKHAQGTWSESLPNKRNLSGGMQAGVSSTGALIWD